MYFGHKRNIYYNTEYCLIEDIVSTNPLNESTIVHHTSNELFISKAYKTRLIKMYFIL